MKKISKLDYRYHLDDTNEVSLLLVVKNGDPHFRVEWMGGTEFREFPCADYIGARKCYEENGGF